MSDDSRTDFVDGHWQPTNALVFAPAFVERHPDGGWSWWCLGKTGFEQTCAAARKAAEESYALAPLMGEP